MGKEFGWVILCTDMQICDTPQAICPSVGSPTLCDEDKSM